MCIHVPNLGLLASGIQLTSLTAEPLKVAHKVDFVVQGEEQAVYPVEFDDVMVELDEAGYPIEGGLSGVVGRVVEKCKKESSQAAAGYYSNRAKDRESTRPNLLPAVAAELDGVVEGQMVQIKEEQVCAALLYFYSPPRGGKCSFGRHHRMSQ